MNTIIWKFTMDTQRQTFDIPVDAKFLAMQLQNGSPALWFEVDPSEPVEMRDFVVCVTGGTLPSGKCEYLGTFQKDWFVGHVYEVDLI